VERFVKEDLAVVRGDDFAEAGAGLLPLDARVLAQLRAGSAGLDAMARTLGCSKPSLRKSLDNLAEAGFGICERPGVGLSLESAPSALIGDDVLSRMRLPWLAGMRVYRSTGSTNDLATDAGLNGEAAPLAIFAEEQRAGRGRFGRLWHSAAGEGIWGSLLLRPEFALADWVRLTSVAALAVALAVEEVLGLQPEVKWPNDLLLGGKKFCGVLTELVHGRGTPFAVLGVGLNANQTEFAPELRERATSLRLELGCPVDRAGLAAALLDHLGELLRTCGEAFGQILGELERRSCVLGRAVTLDAAGRRVAGIAESMDENGHLRVRLPDGLLETFSAGEVSVVARK
jgi:BirA family biotin operon repressor/biotin-[acetyl-CoA-carboxylase] ligase